MSLNNLHTNTNHIVSPSVFYGYNPRTKEDYTFRDTKGMKHVVSSFEDAKVILLVMFSEILSHLQISDEVIENAIKHSPNDNYAYLSLKLS